MHQLSVFLIIVASTLWGTSAIFVTNLRAHGFDSLQMAFLKNLIPAIVLLAFCLCFHKNKIKVSLKSLLIIILGGIGIYGTGAFCYAAMKLTSISVSVVLMYLAPVIVMVYSTIFMGEKFTYTKLLCIIGALVGIALVTGIIGGYKVNFKGICLGLMSGVSYGMYNICAKLVTKRGEEPVVVSTYSFVVAAVFSAILGRPCETFAKIATDIPAILPWAISFGLVTSAFPYTIYTYGIKRLPASVATSLGCVEPMVATLISVLCYNEPITAFSVSGIVIIVFSVVFLSFIKE